MKFLIDIFFRIVAEIVFDVLIKLPGIFLTTRLRIDSDPDGAFVWLIGCVFWAIVIGAFGESFISSESRGNGQCLVHHEVTDQLMIRPGHIPSENHDGTRAISASKRSMFSSFAGMA